MVHSYFTKGLRLTLTFFLFAFIVGIEKEFNSFFAFDFPAFQRPPPFFFPSHNSILVNIIMVIFGWVFIFYLSWIISERINKRLDFFRGKIFPVLFFSGLITASMSYAIETASVSVGWWKWVFKDSRFTNFLGGGINFFALEAWFYFTIHFLGAYFLVECSKYKRSPWKALFLFIYLIRIYSILFFNSSIPREIEERIALIGLVLFSIFCPLQFDYSGIKLPKVNLSALKIIEAAPFVIIISMAAILYYLEKNVISDIKLLFSIIPLLFLVLLSFKNMPFVMLFSLNVILLTIGKQKMIVGSLPILAVTIFSLLENARSYLIKNYKIYKPHV